MRSPYPDAQVGNAQSVTSVSGPQATFWASGDAYERFMGRWSRRIAPRFLEWLSVTPGADWIDVGCGTGALGAAILSCCAPRKVCGIDPTAAFVEAARSQVTDQRWEVRHGSAEAIPYEDNEFATAVSGLVLNIVGDKNRAVAEMKRVVRPGGLVALYVWDYAGHMQIMRYFFDAATELDAGAREFDEGVKAPICRPGPLADLFQEAGLISIEVQNLDIPAAFENFDDYWMPFLDGTGTAPKYCASLSTDAQKRVQEKLRERLPAGPDGEILLAIRAWGVRGRVAK